MEQARPVRILHVVGGMNRAGTETLLMNIYRNVNREKVQFDFISYYSGDAHYDNEIKRFGGRVIKLFRTYSVIELYKAIKKHGPYEAVHGHTLFHCGLVMIAGLLAGVKVRIAHSHTTLDNTKGLIRKFYISFMKIVIRIFSTHLMACSRKAAHYLFGERGIKSNKYSYFPNLINYEVFLKEPLEDVEHFKIKNNLKNSTVIGHVGRFIDSKNHKFIIEILKCALKKRKHIKLLLIGEGDLYQEIKNLVKYEGLENHVVFAGIREDIHTMLHSMDIFVFPSKYEGLGLVLLEAQAAGLPCLVSEAIQPEADLEIGLLNRQSLKESAEVWAMEIFNLAEKKVIEEDKKIKGFIKKGYDFNAGIDKLIQIYKA